MPPNPSPAKIKKYTKARLEGKTKRVSAIEAGYALNSAPKAAGVLEKLPSVREAMSKALDEADCDIAKSAKAISEAHRANVVKTYCHEGEVIESKEYIDHPTRLRAAELASKVRGVFSEDSEGATNQINIGVVVNQIRIERERRGLEA